MTALLLRDLRLAFRSGGGFGLGLAFFLILAVLVPLGVGAEGGTLGRIAPGILWVGALLACLLSLDRIFALDHEDGSLDLLATSPIPLEGVVAVKALAHWLVTGLPLTLLAPGLGVLLNLAPAAYGWLVLSLLLGTPALSMVGTFAAALTVGIRRGGLLLADFRGRGRAPRGRGDGAGDTPGLARSDQPWRGRTSAFRGGGGAPRQFALGFLTMVS